ncbi:MAG: hypothetical protein WCL50_17620, partial [Spirochaetota bacterium]
MRKLNGIPLAVLVCCLAGPPLAAASPEPSAFLLPVLGSPVSTGSSRSVTFLDAPWADRLNPAASGAQQRPVLDLGASLLSDFGGQGYGGALSLGASLPLPYGVWGFGLDGYYTPDTMTGLAIGTMSRLCGGIAKDLFPNFLVGAELGASVGALKGGVDWGLGLDLGVMHKLGDVGPLLDLRYGAVLSNIGKQYSPSTPSLTYLPTLSAGARSLLLRSNDLKLGLGLDLALPSFSDLGFGLSASLVWKDMITLRTGWSFPSVLSFSKSASPIPSIGLMGTLTIDRAKDESFISKNGWDKSEFRPSLSFAPLPGGLWGVSGGLSVPLGVIDNVGPAIEAEFPATSW